jgi:DNA-binding IclR family transcriptional regulator
MQALATVDKALDVLFHLHGEAGGQGVTSIGRALGMPKSSAHRVLAALVRRGLVERDEGGRYRPGIALVALGLGALEREPVVAACRPLLEAEAVALGETCFLVAARARRLVVLDKAEGTGFLRAAPRVGAEVPVHATAVGKLFLGFDPAAVEPPAGALERFTPHTRTRPEELWSEAAEARRRGFARSREEWIAGLSVVAAPVRSGERLAGALALAAPTPRLESLGWEAVARRIRAAADEVAARLAGRGR